MIFRFSDNLKDFFSTEPSTSWALCSPPVTILMKINTSSLPWISHAYNLAQAVFHHTGNYTRRFFGKEIVSKFRTPKLKVTDGVPKLVVNATIVYIPKHGINQSVTTPY